MCFILGFWYALLAVTDFFFFFVSEEKIMKVIEEWKKSTVFMKDVY